MFEKEAEEYADGIYHYKINVSDYGEDGKINYRYSDIKEAHQKGAEFGYNKANEWHILAENQNDLPPKETTVKVLTQNGEICESKYYYDDYYEEYSWSNIGDSKVLGWKEIVFPKESE